MTILRQLLSEDIAQDALEYVLVVGAVVIAVALGLMAFDAVIEGFMGFICPSVDPEAPDVGIGTCLTAIGS